MSFGNFLKESSGNKKLTAQNFTAIIVGVFGPAIKGEIDTSGKGGNKLSVDLSKLKKLVDGIGLTGLSKLVVEEAGEAGIELVPSDHSGTNGLVKGGPGGDDVIALKIKGNDYSSNKDLDETGKFDADLFISLESEIIYS